jgi:tRNA(Ile)-lysidine synthase
MGSLPQNVLKSIERTRLFVPGDRVGAAVSGGADSVAMLRLLHALRAKLGIALFVIHFDHKLREESGDDAKFVRELARDLGLEFVCEEADVAKIAAREKRNLEDAARRLRYAFFERIVESGRATRIGVAHTMDDQAETVLARILRGSGPSGLAGIYPSSGVIARPLLEIRRAALRNYLRNIGQDWREDSTNLDTTRQRARIRHGLLPMLEREFSDSSV